MAVELPELKGQNRDIDVFEVTALQTDDSKWIKLPTSRTPATRFIIVSRFFYQCIHKPT